MCLQAVGGVAQLDDNRPPPLNGSEDVDDTFGPRSGPELLAPGRRPASREQSSHGLRLRIGDLCQRRLAAGRFASDTVLEFERGGPFRLERYLRSLDCGE